MFKPPLYHWPPKSRWLSTPESFRRWTTYSAYFHFPFCRHLCDFCGYETRLIKKGTVATLSEKLLAQVHERATTDDFGDASLRAVFFGGGTASLMPDGLIAGLLAPLLERSKDLGPPEITLECEPGTIHRAKLQDARNAGVNRISVCAQSLSDITLKAIGRKHTTAQSKELLEDTVYVGIDNVHLDLMYGLPGQTYSDWEQTLEAAVRLPISHISAYKLYVFEHGILHRQGHPRAVAESDEITARTRNMHSAAQAILTENGFEQYTLTEYARPRAKSHYILNCFNGDDVLAVGPSAFGRCGTEIWENSPYFQRYIAAVNSGRAYKLSPVEAFKRDVILGLWLLHVDLNCLAQKYSISIAEQLIDTLQQMCAEGFVQFVDNKITLAKDQRFSVGLIMKTLAEVAEQGWGRSEDAAQRFGNQNARTCLPAQSHVYMLDPLARMARRDPRLYDALRRDPNTTLEQLGYDLSEGHIRVLIETITDARSASPQYPEVRQMWTAIRNEHVENIESHS